MIKRTKIQKGILAYDGEDFFPEEFMQKQNEFTREEELLHQNNKSKRNN